MTGKPIDILMVEDNPADVRLTREMFTECNIHGRLSVVKDGVEAMAFLRRQGPYLGAARPDLIILDLNLPRKDGREVLAEVKADPELRRIPIVILSTSGAEADIVKTYNLHANCYIVKPADLDEFAEVVRGIERYWLTMATLPPK
jgi:CheY-like chemotaxis protein